jgi:hypothetical protein
MTEFRNAIPSAARNDQSMLRLAVPFSLLLLCLLFFAPASSAADPDAGRGVPKILRDARTGIIFYLESDHRHVAAIRESGQLLWNRNPVADQKLSASRPESPYIVDFTFIDPTWWKIHRWLGKADDFISVSFNTSQFGVLDKRTGAYTSLGQD